MTLEEEARLSYYKEIAVLSDEHAIYVVQHLETRRVYVKKVLTTYERDVYLYLKDHPISGTPRIYEAIEDNGKLIVIEDYVSGLSLEEWLKENGFFSEEKVVKIIYQLCHILKALHAVKPPIIHRDIKPANVLLTQDDHVTLLDMDAAKLYHKKAQDTMLIGTFGYAAPEQYGFGPSTVQTDIYSLGVLMNVLLTGHFPAEETARGSLKRIVQKCLKMDPAMRYQSMDELIEQLERLITVMESEGASASEGVDLPPGFRSKDPFKIILAVLGYLFLFLACFYFSIPDVEPGVMWLYRITAILAMLSIILFAGNFRGVQNVLGITRIKSLKLQVALIILCDIVIIGFWLGMMLFLKMLFFNSGD